MHRMLILAIVLGIGLFTTAGGMLAYKSGSLLLETISFDNSAGVIRLNMKKNNQAGSSLEIPYSEFNKIEIYRSSSYRNPRQQVMLIGKDGWGWVIYTNATLPKAEALKNELDSYINWDAKPVNRQKEILPDSIKKEETFNSEIISWKNNTTFFQFFLTVSFLFGFMLLVSAVTYHNSEMVAFYIVNSVLSVVILLVFYTYISSLKARYVVEVDKNDIRYSVKQFYGQKERFSSPLNLIKTAKFNFFYLSDSNIIIEKNSETAQNALPQANNSVLTSVFNSISFAFASFKQITKKEKINVSMLGTVEKIYLQQEIKKAIIKYNSKGPHSGNPEGITV